MRETLRRFALCRRAPLPDVECAEVEVQSAAQSTIEKFDGEDVPSLEQRPVLAIRTDAPPAYERVQASGSGAPKPAAAAPTIERTTHAGEPTILVLFKEDYAWARAYMKEFDYKHALRKVLRRHLYKWYALLVIIITVSALVSAKHTTIVDFCRPVSERIRSWPGGWLIPIAFLIIVSFPPLIGHEIIGILCGLVWGLWTGFGILCAGTFFGEIATWVAFKWMCTTRARKFEARNRLYATLTQLIREKSFMFVLVLRFSAVPGHIVTAVSASAGANVWSYLAAAFLTLPKQFVITYLGTSFGTHSKKDTIVSWSVTAATFIGTVVAAVYIYYQMRLVFRRQEAARLPLADPRTPADRSRWADVAVHGAAGVGAGTRLEYEDAAHARRSVDVIIGPHARLAAQKRYAPSPLSASRTPRTPKRTRSLPGLITEDEMRAWLAQLDTALVTATGPRDSGEWDADLAQAGPTRSRSNTGQLEPLPYSYSQTLLLSPPLVEGMPPSGASSPPIATLGLPELAHEHITPSPAPGDGPGDSSRPGSGTVPAILLTPTYTTARKRASSLRGTVSLDLERPRLAVVEETPRGVGS